MPSVSLLLEQTRAALARPTFESFEVTLAGVFSYSVDVFQSLRSMRVLPLVGLAAISVATPDPCALIGRRTWVEPKLVRECFSSFPVNATEKENILDVVTKTLNFDPTINYAIHAPAPFSTDVRVDIMSKLARIREKTYESDFAFHLDLSNAIRRLNDGHTLYLNYCYDSLFFNYVPLPLALLTDNTDRQHVHISPDAFTIAKSVFQDEQLQFWENALPRDLRGQLESLAGAKVIQINGQDPFRAVDRHAEVVGGFQGLSSRQNGFFTSYKVRGQESRWSYLLGQFAEQALPLTDSVTMTVERADSTVKTFTLPYRARFTKPRQPFRDSTSFRAQHCRARDGTNGRHLYPEPSPKDDDSLEFSAAAPFQQAEPISAAVDTQPPSKLRLPSAQWPYSAEEGFVADPVGNLYFERLDNITGVLALGSFLAPGDDELKAMEQLQRRLRDGLVGLKRNGAQRLIVDVTNNNGGHYCVAHWLHRIIAGPRATTEPQAGLDTKARAGTLARLIVDKIVQDGVDKKGQMRYFPFQHRFANGTDMPWNYNWLEHPVKTTVNEREDAFSQRLGYECQPFTQPTPNYQLFDPQNVVIVSNGRCASACGLFAVTMAKLEGARTVVVGGKHGVRQQYCGSIGGEASSFSSIDSEVKTAGLKNHPLAPPDFMTNSVQGIVWRLAFGVRNPEEPEEWQAHEATVELPLTA